MKVVISVISVAVFVWSVEAISDEFVEELYIKPLYSEQVLAHFQFSTKWDTDVTSNSFYHTRLFPRVLGEIIGRHNVQEFHLSLTTGLWRYEKWGYPVTSAATGAELWAWFRPDTEDVDKNWKELASSLSGLICASLNFIDETNSVVPDLSFRPSGVVTETANNTFLRYSALPREIVCTENLTPLKKLLPCGSKGGLAALLLSGYVHNTRYHSIGIHLRPICSDSSCKRPTLELQASVTLVYDYHLLGTRNWSLRRFFGSGIFGPCPLAKSSTVYVDVTGNASQPFTLNPEPDEFVTSIRGGHVSRIAKYVVTHEPLAIAATAIGQPTVQIISPPPLHANQYLTGYGQERGGIVLKLYNNHWGELDVVVLQNIPWFVRLYYHTLRIRSNGRDNVPLSQRYVPGQLRKRSYFIELALRLPPKSETSVSLEFEHVFLKWTEYPPDASHGFYIGSAVVSAMLPLAKNFTALPQDGTTIADSFNASRSGYLVQLRTEVMVTTLPIPDFSMPYNVICLACTVVALAFGPLHNITTKRLVLKPLSSEKLLVRIKNRVVGIICGAKKEKAAETVVRQ